MVSALIGWELVVSAQHIFFEDQHVVNMANFFHIRHQGVAK
jgi:hypothetical protein